MQRKQVVEMKGACLRRVLLCWLCAVLLGSTDVWAQSLTYFRTDDPSFVASARFGKQMFQTYQCAKCHATHPGEPLTSDIVAPNLVLAKERLRPEWILQWLIDPQTLQPGTKMPNYFSFNEDDDYNPIYGDADAHVHYRIILALRDYLMVLGTEQEKELDAAPAP